MSYWWQRDWGGVSGTQGLKVSAPPERRWLTSDWVRRCYPGVAPSLTADGLARAAVRKFAPNQGLGCAPKEHPNSRPSGAPGEIRTHDLCLRSATGLLVIGRTRRKPVPRVPLLIW